jgi:hypothetical protein
MKESSAFVKGAAWGAGFTLHEIATTICMEDDDARTLIQRHRKSPPVRRLSKPRRRKEAVPA